MKRVDLKKRWNCGSGAEFAKWLFGEIAKGCEITSSPFGTHNGRVDLRGLTLSPEKSLRRVKMRGVDLTGAVLTGLWIEACSFEDVTFDEVTAVRMADHDNRFTHCTFVGANLREAAIGYRGSVFQRVDFVETEFKRTIFIRPEFDDVTFTDCRFEGIDFNASSFRRCEFRGEVKEVWFRGGFAFPGDIDRFGTSRPNKMEQVSFEKARLFGVTYSDGCDLSTVLLPSDGSCQRFDRWKQRLEKLLEFAATRPGAEQKEIEIFCHAHLVHAPSQDSYIVSMDEIRSDFGDDLARVIVDALLAA